ncbi:MAG: hypothetical protein J4F42_07720 [Desulfurellaceae bacterium]|nr:hypothetical protein [Desulfurellaceae bacterium]
MRGRADEIEGYTGQALQAFIAAGSDTGDNDGQRAAIAERQLLLAGALVDVLKAALPAASFELDTCRQPSRLYGHGLADLIALASIAELSQVTGPAKFESAYALLRTDPETVELRIEDGGPR